MNQVDIYIGDYRLDLFQDEEISISLNVQNIQDLSKIFTDFTQSFTIPATAWNNEVLHHYYRTDVDSSQITKRTIVDNSSAVMGLLGYVPDTITETSAANSFDFRLRPSARIEINSLPFRTGVIEMENVLMKGTEPYSYSLSFYGDLVNLTDLFGEDYLYDLDLSAYDHTYDGATILQGVNSNALFSGDVFYPLMSPVRNWVYNVSNSSDPRHEDDIQFVTGHAGHHHGVHYYEVKPAIKVLKILEAIEAKYGVDFVGDFMTDAQFEKLYMWAHRYEGYMYENQPNGAVGQLVNFNAQTISGFDLANDWWLVPSGANLQNIEFNYNIDSVVYTQEYYVDIYKDDVLYATNAHTGNVIGGKFVPIKVRTGERWQLKLRPSTQSAIAYRFTQFFGRNVLTLTKYYEVRQTIFATYQVRVNVSSLMPEIKIKDFLSGIVKMHNLVVTPNSSTEFNLQTLDGWYADGTDQDLTQYIDIEEVTINRPPIYREIDFKYQETEQILGFEYKRTNPYGVGYGDLNAKFNFDADTYKVELPFECPLFERLSDIDNGTLTNILVYKSQTREFDTDFENRFQPYVGAPILIYGEFSLDINANPISFVDESNTQTQVNEVWYANTSSTSLGVGTAYSLAWGADIDPYYLTSVTNSLYATYWEDYITDLYNTSRRLVEVEAILPLGKILNLQLNNKIIWNNQRWIVNSANINMTTGKATFELLNDV